MKTEKSDNVLLFQPGHIKDHHKKNGTNCNCLPAWHACVKVGV